MRFEPNLRSIVAGFILGLVLFFAFTLAVLYFSGSLSPVMGG